MDELATKGLSSGSLVLAAHPNWRESRVNRRLLAAAQGVAGVQVRDLYSSYADYDIDVPAEQALATQASLIVLMHPIQWYSMPALLKLWLDEVLTYGWAYGPGGTALKGKDLWLVATTGGPEGSYHPASYNRYFFDAFLPPYEQTAVLCGMRFLPPLVLHGARSGERRGRGQPRAGLPGPPAHLSAMARARRARACPECEVPTTDRPGVAGEGR